MSGAVVRKARQLAGDPVLRRWLMARSVGRCRGEPAFEAHRPPYSEVWLPLERVERGERAVFSDLPADPPPAPVVLSLPGEECRCRPSDVAGPFGLSFADAEALLALHRFAWLPLVPDIDPRWVSALWRAWRNRFGTPGEGWPWHPYTAAERAINILDYGRRVGLPQPLDDTLAVLAAHAPAIASRLEYFGEHHTSNHLANNGRGLYILGLELGMPQCAELGARILLEEARRIFWPSGVLREGSSNYHLLVAKNYTTAWLAARRHGRPEEAALREITARAMAVIPWFLMPGGFPFVGDITPDCPPEHLACLTGGGGEGWLALLDDEERAAVMALQAAVAPADAEALRRDGWLRADFGIWSGLWHAAPQGWSHMPGHGHQDCGSFELHLMGGALFVDPGRGAYGDEGEAALYRSAKAHNGLLVDGKDPYAPNRPYYDEGFRRRVGGAPVELVREGNSVRLRFEGFQRLRRVGAAARRWTFEPRALLIEDAVEGRGRRLISRLFHTTLPVRRDGGKVVIGEHAVLSADAPVRVEPATRWTAYGRGVPASRIVVETKAALPWQGQIRVEVR